MRELSGSPQLVIHPNASSLSVVMTEQQFVLKLQNGEGDSVAQCAIPHNTLAALYTEYVDIVRQMAAVDGSGPVTRLEALDMAKKATHDRAGRVIKRTCSDFELDHATSRRLFTLLFALRVDTTRLVGVHGHRSVR